MRTKFLFAVGLAIVVTAGPSTAQNSNSSVYPWQRNGAEVQLQGLRDPFAKIRARNEANLKKLGLQSNKRLPGIENRSMEASGTVGLNRFSNLDADRNGGISREEYMSGRFRLPRFGKVGSLKRRYYKSKLVSRFRAADLNNDGSISAQEISKLRNPRF